jgi:hypothetical protein
MAAQPFFVNSVPMARGYALAAYHPLTVRSNGGRVRNPKFDSHSQQILNLKDASKPGYFLPALKYCAAHLENLFANEIPFERGEIVIVPSSAKGNVNPGLDRIAQALCKRDKRLSYAPNSLFRAKSIDKLSKGGDRSLEVHLKSMDYKGVAGSPGTKFILDDVTTSGNSLNAAITIIQQYMDGLTFIPVVLGKTVDDSF